MLSMNFKHLAYEKLFHRSCLNVVIFLFFDREQRSKSGLKNYLVVIVDVFVFVLVVQYFLN